MTIISMISCGEKQNLKRQSTQSETICYCVTFGWLWPLRLEIRPAKLLFWKDTGSIQLLSTTFANNVSNSCYQRRAMRYTGGIFVQ